MDDGVIAICNPLFASDDRESQKKTVLAGGAWSYVSLDQASQAALELLVRLDGTDVALLPLITSRSGIDTDVMASLINTLVDQGTLRLIGRGARPARRLVLELLLLTLIARALLMLAPRRVMRFIAVRVAPEAPDTAEPPPGWLGTLGEQVIAAHHRAAAFPLSTTLCVPVAIATFIAVRRRGRTAFFRLAVVDEPFDAHVWVVCDGKDVDPRSDAFAGSPLSRVL